MNAEIVVAWPCLLDGRIRLQLVLDAIITSSKDGVTEARILAYDFRTAGPADTRVLTQPANHLRACGAGERNIASFDEK
jgi:hypothetical protein